MSILLNTLMDKKSQGFLFVIITLKNFFCLFNFHNLLPLSYSTGAQCEINAPESNYDSQQCPLSERLRSTNVPFSLGDLELPLVNQVG